MSHEQKASIPPTSNTPAPTRSTSSTRTHLLARVHIFNVSTIIDPAKFSPTTKGFGICEICEQTFQANQRIVGCLAEGCGRLRHYFCEVFRNEPFFTFPCSGRTGLKMDAVEVEEWKRAQAMQMQRWGG
ncbi:hypothetical protein BJ508DRAFT_314197 [Ascobolus immersus RN42]|uniref:Uncharacterized protein n=1 Tax=Ascobolus immersus RN42 TaxID=1160509 RepID=A0A3N4HHZ0_ASCIM|nr:hypothetical protein BJ508DRAFT_314197 [Ascobolus immersus RN42]